MGSEPGHERTHGNTGYRVQSLNWGIQCPPSRGVPSFCCGTSTPGHPLGLMRLLPVSSGCWSHPHVLHPWTQRAPSSAACAALGPMMTPDGRSLGAAHLWMSSPVGRWASWPGASLPAYSLSLVLPSSLFLGSPPTSTLAPDSVRPSRGLAIGSCLPHGQTASTS